MLSDDREELAVIRKVAHDLPLGIWVARASSGEEVFANARFAEIMGMGLVGTVSVGEYAVPYGIHDREGKLYPEGRMPFVRALEAGGPVEVDDIVIHRSDGSRVFVRATAQPTFDAEGRPEYVVIAFNDITAEVRAQEREQESVRRAERAARREAIGDLAGGLAHDFNNLLAIIRTTAYLVEKEPDADKRARDLRVIRETTDRAALLTRSLLSFAGRLEGRREPLRLDEVVRDLAPMIERLLDRRIDVHIQADSRRELVGDRAQLEQVVMNLVFNALAAMPEGGRLDVTTRDEGEETVLEVKDTGVGIPLEAQERIFEPYFSTRKSAVYEGRGLGLATVYGAVTAHGGSLRVDSTPGAGTLMSIRFPSGQAGEAPRAAPPTAQAGGSHSGRILVVDDAEAVRYVTSRALRSLSFQTVLASDGAEGVALFREQHEEIDAVLLDMQMPGLGGREALRLMRETDERVPVVILTGYAGSAERESLLALGAAAYLAKPVDVDELARVLSEVIDASRSAQAAPTPGEG